MLMMCLHKHSIGACAHIREMIDPQSFIRTHVDVVMRGLAVRPEGDTAEPQNKKLKRVA
jgi:TetR/AcrR family transcriptional regulator